MKWNAKHEAAALAVAEDVLSDVKIAGAAGVTKKTLETWKQEPQFRERVESLVAAISAETQRYGIARVARRVARLNEDYKALQQIILDRAEFYQNLRLETEARIQALEVSGAGAEAQASLLDADGKAAEAKKARREVGRLAGEAFRERQSVCFHPGMDTGWLLVQYKPRGIDVVLDTGTEAALRALEQQAAKELGQWTEKSKIDHDFTSLSDAELVARAAGLLGGSGAPGTDADADSPDGL